jgi:hypothetical protein
MVADRRAASRAANRLNWVSKWNCHRHRSAVTLCGSFYARTGTLVLHPGFWLLCLTLLERSRVNDFALQQQGGKKDETGQAV